MKYDIEKNSHQATKKQRNTKGCLGVPIAIGMVPWCLSGKKPTPYHLVRDARGKVKAIKVNEPFSLFMERTQVKVN